MRVGLITCWHSTVHHLLWRRNGLTLMQRLCPMRSLPHRAEKPREIIDWGEGIAVPLLYGRERELETLHQWVVDNRCRVVTVVGLGGIGKSSLAITLAHDVVTQFDVVLFRSLLNGPLLTEVL